MTQYLVEKYGADIGTTLIEVEVDTLKSSYNLPDDAILREKTVLALLVPDNADDNAKSPRGRNLVSNAAIRNAYLTLKILNDDKLDLHPLSDLLVTESQKQIRLLKTCELNPQKSFITVGDTTLLTAGESFLLLVVYHNV